MAEVIMAIGTAVAAILGGVAAILAASARRNTQATQRTVTEVSEQVTPSNGRRLAQTVERIEGQLYEHLSLVTSHMRTLGTVEEAQTLVAWMRKKMEEEKHGTDIG